MTRTNLWLLLLLIAGNVASGIGVVYAKYLTRAEFVRLQTMGSDRDALEVSWNQLRLEEAALTTHPRVEAKARELLDMHLPRDVDVRVIEGGVDGG